MPDAAMIRKQVEARIAELDALIAPLRAEYDQLKSVAASIGSGGQPARSPSAAPRPSRAKSAPRRSGGSPRAASGDANRARQAVELIRAQPGITAAELAQAIGTSRNYLYRVLPKLEASGEIAKRGRGYEVVADSSSSAGGPPVA